MLKRCRLTSKQRQSPLDLGVHTRKAGSDEYALDRCLHRAVDTILPPF
jgi:hypothetical protein